jgi:hypothetical protein
VSWVKLDTFWFADEDVEAAGEIAGPMVFAVFPVLLAMSKSQNEGGKVKITYRKFAETVFGDWDQLAPALDALVSAGVLSCPESSARGATVAFDPESWLRWNDTVRKAEERAGKRGKPKGGTA